MLPEKKDIFPMLAVETTGPYSSVALALSEDEIYSQVSMEKLNHLKGLVPSIDEIVTDNDLKISQIKTIAVSHGPGSFTGIRIGISTVRGIAQVTGAKIISVPTLESFIYNEELTDTIICPMFDARRNQMYSGAFLRMKPSVQIKSLQKTQSLQKEFRNVTLVEPGAYDPDDMFSSLHSVLAQLESAEGSLEGTAYNKDSKGIKIRFYGDGIPVFEDMVREWADGLEANVEVSFAEDEVRYQNALSVAKLAMFSDVLPIDYKEVFPVYMRQAEAQRKLDESNDKSSK